MNQRISKELRHLFPTWAAAFCLTTIPLLLSREGDAFFLWLICFGFGAVLLSVRSFGAEFTGRTYLLYLVQPLSRHRLWVEKVAVLLAAVVLLAPVFLAYALIQLGPGPAPGWELFFLTVFSVGLAAVGGSLFFTVLFRQVHAAICFSILVPLALGILAESATSRFLSPAQAHFAALLTFAAYGAAGIMLGYWAFRRFQDAELFRGELAIPGLLRPGSGFLSRLGFSPATRALIAKEIHLQQINIIVAGLLYGLYFLVATLKTEYEWQSITWYLPRLFLFLWCLLPILIGAAAVAEERRLGTLNPVLPVDRKHEWRVKVNSVCGLSILLGAVIPWFLISTSDLRALIPWALNPLATGLGGEEIRTDNWQVRLIAFLIWMVLVIGISSLSLYASSQARNLLESLGLVVALALLFGCVIRLMTAVTEQLEPRPWVLMSLLSVPLFFLPVRIVSFRNYLAHLITPRVWIWNLGALLGCYALLVLATTAIYFRAWEKVWYQPAPRKGAPLTGNLEPKIAITYGFVLAISPDGKLWSWGNLPVEFEDSSDHAGKLAPLRLAGSAEWKDIQGNHLAAGVRGDGTLWSWRYRWIETRTAGPRFRLLPLLARKPVQIGTEADWVKVACGVRQALALKSDGSLWAWGRNGNGQLGDGTFADQEFPVRVAGEWKSIATGWNRSLGIQKDGSLWEWGLSMSAGEISKLNRFEPVKVAVPTRVGQQTNWQQVVHGEGYLLAIQQDGSLWGWGMISLLLADAAEPKVSTIPVPIAVGNRWRAAASSWQRAMAIKDDGSLWEWRDRYFDAPWRKRRPQPVRVGRRTDWMTVANTQVGFVGLTADGGLWSFGPFYEQFFPRSPRLLRPSRRPQLLGYLTESWSAIDR